MKLKKLLKNWSVCPLDGNCNYDYNDMIEFAKYAIKQQLTLTDVSHRRELLLDYERYKEKYPLIGLETDEWKIDKFLSQ